MEEGDFEYEDVVEPEPVVKFKWAPLPRSRAKTAHGLLTEICKLIEEEPKRYDQFDLLRDRRDLEYDLNAGHLKPEGVPACGTIGCVAGWTYALKHRNLKDHDDEYEYARKKLGLDTSQARELFAGDAAGSRYGLDGIAGHAERGIAHIRRFQAKYASQLKKTKV